MELPPGRILSPPVNLPVTIFFIKMSSYDALETV